MRNRPCFAALILVPVLAGCGSTAYRPHASPRLQVIADGAASPLARDGHTYAIGMFGSGLEDAVRGNARAEKEVSSYQAKSVGGFVLGLLGSLAGASGAGLLVGNELSRDPSTTARVGAISLAVGGIVASLVGTLLTSSAQPHMWNAINMYNDDLPPPWGFAQQPYGQPYGAPGGGYNVPLGPGGGYNQPSYGTQQPWVPSAAPGAPARMPGAPAPLPSAPAPMPSAPLPNAPLPNAPAPGAPPSPAAPR